MSIWDYRKNFAYDEPLNPGDSRLVDLNQARGQYDRKRLLRTFGLHGGELRDPPSGCCVLFGGHRGCGKSTELREIALSLKGPQHFFVIDIDAVKDLDINNLTYADMAVTLAQALIKAAEAAQIPVHSVFLSPFHDWYKQVSHLHLQEASASAELQAGIEATLGLPLLAKLFAKLTTAIRSNATYKTEIRENVRNSFTRLAEAFNTLLVHIEEQIIERGLGKSIVFVIDGTDRLSGIEADNLFIRDIYQLRQLQANCIYCAPISVLNEQGQIAQNFDAIFRLPMVKLAEKGEFEEHQRISVAWNCLREFITSRLPLEYFDSPMTLDALIDCSGGHPRDLLRLVNLCFQEIDDGPITCEVAEIAVRRLCNEYRRLLQPEDWQQLVEIDGGDKEYTPATEQTRRMLYDLVLLEYNAYWWQSHPAVRMLEAYKKQKAKHSASNSHHG